MVDVKNKVVLIDHNGQFVQYSIYRCRKYRLSDEVQDMMHYSDNAADIAPKEDADRHSEEQQ